MSLKVILGSSSPRRKSILSLLHPDFTIINPDIDETAFPDEMPQIYAMRISNSKSKKIALEAIPETPRLIITSDTIVAIGNIILGKPSSHDDAFRMIKLLSGKTHLVISAITLCYSSVKASFMQCRTEITEITFHDLSDSRIEEYIKTADCADKAGSYAIQESGGELVKSVSGSLSNVVGFPVGLFLDMVADMNIPEFF